MNINLLIVNVVVISLVVAVIWIRSEISKRSETRRANGQLRLLGPTDELSELTQVVREWADTNGVLKERPDVLPDFGGPQGNNSSDGSEPESDDDGAQSDVSEDADDKEKVVS